VASVSRLAAIGHDGGVSDSFSKPGTIAYQGEAGANSDIACHEVYPDWETLPCPSFEDVFAAIEEGRAQLGMIPIDNSIAGRVADIHHFLPNSGLHIVGEVFLPVHLQLLAVPGATKDSIKTVHSHIHALGQCRKIINALGLRPVMAGDTAGSAREVAEWNDPSKASLATSLAADIYGLETLAADVEDEVHNTTRFVILSQEYDEAPPGDRMVVTTFVFRVRNLPASLYKALGGFATNGVNMTKLEAYMVDGGFTATMFLADVEGHPSDPGLCRALEELEFFTTELKILGVYPAHSFRVDQETRNKEA
jgi:prephenate dehydratase